MSAAPDGRHVDLLVIGAGPAGRRAAIEGARLGARTAVVERSPEPGAAGALAFRSLHAAAADAIAARRIRPPRGGERPPPLADLLWRADRLVEGQRDAVRDQLRHEHVEVVTGAARFAGPHDVDVAGHGGAVRVRADRIVIATGSVPRHPPGTEPGAVLAPEALPRLRELPARLAVVGAGLAGLEIASVAAALGAAVTLIDRDPEPAAELDHELVAALLYHLRGVGVTVRLGRAATSVARAPSGGVVVRLQGGEEVTAEVVVHAAGRDGATAGLALEATGLHAGPHGRIAVDARGRTAVPHVFAAGDVTGAPGRAAAAMDAGRRAALAALGRLAPPPRSPLPLAAATLPEIAAAGPTERTLAAARVAPVRGVARFAGLVRGELSGERAGMLKLLADPATGRLLAVHILGGPAGEIVHVGQAAVAAGATVDELADAVPGPATFAEAYAVAAADAAARIRLGDDRRCEGRAAAPTLGA